MFRAIIIVTHTGCKQCAQVISQVIHHITSIYYVNNVFNLHFSVTYVIYSAVTFLLTITTQQRQASSVRSAVSIQIGVVCPKCIKETNCYLFRSVEHFFLSWLTWNKLKRRRKSIIYYVNPALIVFIYFINLGDVIL